MANKYFEVEGIVFKDNGSEGGDTPTPPTPPAPTGSNKFYIFDNTQNNDDSGIFPEIIEDQLPSEFANNSIVIRYAYVDEGNTTEAGFNRLKKAIEDGNEIILYYAVESTWGEGIHRDCFQPVGVSVELSDIEEESKFCTINYSPSPKAILSVSNGVINYSNDLPYLHHTSITCYWS